MQFSREKYFLVATLLFSLSFSVVAKDNHELTLGNFTQFFTGDPLDNWTDPHDERFKDINLKAFFSNEFNTKIRKELYELKQSYIAKFAKIYNRPGADYLALQKELTKDLMTWTAQHVIAAVPSSVSPNDYAFVAFGSAGRLESGIVTDLEGGLLLSDNVSNQAQVGLQFGTQLGTILNGLIGHPIYGRKGYRLDEQSNAPIHFAPFIDSTKNLGEILCPMITSYSLAKTNIERSFWGKYFYPFEGTHVLATTAQNLAEYARGVVYNMPQIFQLRVDDNARKQAWYKWAAQFLLKDTYTDADFLNNQIKNSSCGKNLDATSLTNWVNYFLNVNQTNELKVVSAFSDIGRNHYFVAGNKALYDKFVAARNKILDEKNGEIRKKIASLNFNELITKWSQKKYGGEMFVEGKLPTNGVFDIKRHNYRLIEQFLTALQSYLALDVQNPKDIIDELVKRGMFGEDFSHYLLNTVNHLTKLRWVSQIKVDGQLEASMDFLTPTAYKSKLDSLIAAQKSEAALVQSAQGQSSLAYLMARSNLADINYDLEKMANLEPLKRDSVLNQDEINYLQYIIVPVEQNLFKRIVAFIGKQNNNNLAPNPNAFHDDFDVTTVNLADYGVRVR